MCSLHKLKVCWPSVGYAQTVVLWRCSASHPILQVFGEVQERVSLTCFEYRHGSAVCRG